MKGPALAWPGPPPPHPASKGPPWGQCGGEGWHWDPLWWAVHSTQCQPTAVPRTGQDPPHILGGDAQNIRVRGAGCGGRGYHPLSLVPGGPSKLGLLLNEGGSPGMRQRGFGGICFSAMGPAWRPGPFREVEEGEVSWRRGRVGTSITRVCPSIPQHRSQLDLGSPSGMFPQ